jgi:hypothetical protein
LFGFTNLHYFFRIVERATITRYELASASPVKGSSVSAAMSWGGGNTSLSPLAGQQVKVKVAMADAKLFSIQLACAN